jgi:hypothetical protein
MKLSKENIDFINVYLVKKGIKYLDVKLEMIDHIASEIEIKMELENLIFDDAFNLVIRKWQYQFVQRSSFWVGAIYSFPKVVLDKIVTRAKLTTVCSLVFIVLCLTLYGHFETQLNKILAPFSQAIVISSIVVALSILSIVIYINIKSKPTSFRFLVNQSSPILMFVFFIVMLDNQVVQLQFFYFAILSFYSFFIFKNFISHRNFIKKIK